MKIVYITKSFALKAGVERVLADKMNYLVEHHNYEVSLITYEQGNHPQAYTLNESIKTIDINKRFFKLSRYNIFLRIWKTLLLKKAFKKDLSAQLSRINPDIVISNTYSFNLFDIILNLNYHHIVESHIYINDVCNETKCHNSIMAFIARKWDNLIFRYISKADAFITLTHTDEAQWRKKIKTKIITIPNIVTDYPKEINRSNDLSKRIICVGRLNYQKGFDLLIKAWSLIAQKYPDWHIDIFGTGDDKDSLNDLISNYKLNDSLKINRPVDNIYNEYMNSSFFVLSSRYEGFGLVLIESMSCGIPVVSFNCPHGPSEIINHKSNGLLVKAENISELAGAIEWMILHKESRVQMGEQARLTSKNYTKDNIMPLWINLFETISTQ